VKSPFGKHICPACGCASKFRLTFSYLAFLVMVWIVFFALALVVTFLIFPKTWEQVFDGPYFVFLYFVGCLVTLPCDKLFDERFRKLEKQKDETGASS
jgi:hypothetical protein